MDASPILRDALGALNRARLEAVMIGNAAAALHGAPVTTIDVDFMIRETPGNLRKLKTVARELGAVIMRPYYPVSKLYRLTNDDRGLQLDFMPAIHGIRSFEGLRSRATRIRIEGEEGLLASLEESSAARNPPPVRATRRFFQFSNRLSMSRSPNKKGAVNVVSRRRQLAALKRESEHEMAELIRRRLAMPIEKRTHFLRVRLPLPNGGSCL